MKFKKIETEQSARRWLLKNYKNFINNIQMEYNNENTIGYALYCYTGSMSKDYNDIIYEAKGKIDDISSSNNDFLNKNNNIKKIHKSFELNKISENITLYHYISTNPKELLKKISENNNEFYPCRFMSTTILRNCDGIKKLIRDKKYNVLFQINVTKGTKCIPILWKNNQSYLSEYEIILEPTIKLKLIKFKKRHFSRIKYILEFEILK